MGERMIQKLICIFRGHRRGRFVKIENGLRIFSCPRCGREKTYKTKPQ